MKRIHLLGLLIVGVTAAAALSSSHLAYSDEAETIQFKKDLSAILASQEIILQELKSIREELNIVKIRCSS